MNKELVKPATVTFVQKYGLKYYSVIVVQISLCLILVKTRNINLGLSFFSFYNMLGHLLPLKQDQQKQISKYQNNNKFLLIPLILNCLSAPAILYFFWRNYDVLVPSQPLYVFLSLLVCVFPISSSINAAHQLLHRNQLICQIVSYVNLFCFQFTIYPTQHLYMHHKKVSTPQDPITSPKNQSVYRFYFNALYSCYKFTYNYSKKIFLFNVSSTILYNLLLVGFALKQGSGISKAIYFSSLSYLSLFLMQGIQYIQHYGLIYRKDDKAKPVSELCSWNTKQNQLLNWFVFKFQSHSDHHMNAYKIYPTLDLTEKMPQFPFDFVQGTMISLIPPLWYKLVNPLVDQVIQGTPVGKGHMQIIKICTYFINIFLFIMFPIRLTQHLLA